MIINFKVNNNNKFRSQSQFDKQMTEQNQELVLNLEPE